MYIPPKHAYRNRILFKILEGQIARLRRNISIYEQITTENVNGTVLLKVNILKQVC